MATSVTKKSSLCRYFIRYGDCFHGDKCQFIHALPPQSSPQPPSTPTMVEPPTPTPLNYNQQQSHMLPSNQQVPPPLQTQTQQQQQQQPPPQQQQGHAMNKLICSFRSDLPNEIDFAMQIATLVANTDNFTWHQDYPLIDAICSSLHVYICVCGNSASCYCYPRFWHKILLKHANNQCLQAATVPPDMDISFMNFENLTDHDSNNHAKVYKRIKTVAELIKQFSMTTGVSRDEKEDQITNNFSYHQMKKKKLKASPSLLKFVSLLLHCDDMPLNLIGLDIISNTASKLAKIPEVTNDSTYAKLVQMFQDYCISNISRTDGDIYIVNRSIEVVSRLLSTSSRRASSSITSSIVENDIVFRIEQFLTCQYDVTLFLSALECCYRMSRHHPHLLTTGRAKYLMKILVNLLNCDDNRYFTPKALKRIKLVDEEESTVHYLTTLTRPAAPAPVKAPPPRGPPNQTQAKPNVNNQQTAATATPKQTIPAPNPSKVAPAPTPQPAEPVANHQQPNATANHQQPNATANQVSKPQESAKEVSVVTNNQQPALEISCKWDGCDMRFTEVKSVYTHVYTQHINSLPNEALSSCLWSSPNGTGPGCLTRRPKYSLLTHLSDFHCSQAALTRPNATKPPEHPGYAPNAALVAIKRHANIMKDRTLNNQTQSPLSTSVRLTAALILRNLACESAQVKQALEDREPLLSEICMTHGRDESKIIAECLGSFSKE